MRLERLEISGFKSFSDRAELAFDRGVTAIVGPNGCGKSNVADAITWVLGEQSAKSLRGEKMEDVIFSGSDARKAGATAEVRLRLGGLPVAPKVPVDSVGGVLPAGEVLQEFRPADADRNGRANGHTNGHANGHANGHHAESLEVVAQLTENFTRDVEVTRRLYRSGESEYLIDGEVCRLKDVHELLMDTGLGAKAYAIIEQGKIGMILSTRPTDRRQLIEEAAGITKYKSRRRAAELKLEAAQQNLTRIDDIVFEVEKQRGTLKRQAAKARRYKKLRDEWRRWEKVLFARKYRELAHAIELARTRLADARERETGAAARLAEVEADLSRLRIEQAEADTRASRIREDAHGRELEINRRQQQQEFNRQQAESLAGRATQIEEEIRDLEGRREPARLALESRRGAAADADRSRDDAAGVLAVANEAVAAAQQQIEGLEAEVEAARAEGFRAHNAVTTLHHAVQHAMAQHDRVGETVGKLDVEQDDLRRESEKVGLARTEADDALGRAHQGLESIRLERTTRESELSTARNEHEWRARDVRAREQELAASEARLASLQELASSRAEFSDAARMVLVQANGHVGQQGAVADYLEVDTRYERAVEACLGDLLQHVIVERHDQAAAGLSLVRGQDAGRCGFVVIDPGSNGFHPHQAMSAPGITPVSQVMRVLGPHASTIHKVLPDAYVAESFDHAVAFSRETPALIATLDGDVFRGPHLVTGGAKAESRGILATRREIKELRDRVDSDREALNRLVAEADALELTIAQATTAIAALTAEQHRLEKAIVVHEAQVAGTVEDVERLTRKSEVIALERRRAEEERAELERRRSEAEASIVRLEEEQRQADARLNDAQRRLAAARDEVATLSAGAAEARAAHAALVERAAALSSEVLRLEEAARELETRMASRTGELEQTRETRERLLTAIDEGERILDEQVRALEALREALRMADDAANELRITVDAQDAVIREARGALEAVRAEAGDLEIARATAQSDLGHLAQSCIDAVQATLDEVLADVEQMEAAGETTPDAAAITAEEPDPEAEEGEQVAAVAAATPPSSMSAEEAIVALKGKIERLGPVNMMAIEQFDELETRHVFLTTQRADLLESIAQTAEAIKRIDETTKARFKEAFTAIQENFQGTFSTLFGGGRAGLTLLDENDPLESGIDIVASPPGKRLQSVQLLSGGEKALTAIALMFAIFKFKPSPFCLLDEIDAPLDDANVGRFVEMLRGMLDRTQFILITHNRRTMEIANRLYGVTMEEPGVSKLISVQLN
ncbi:MAG TPA: chromosome segregation protein SMC [Vicinamibacterales bacterium]|nr:chromosome segregation protein SMC [Vicinamibacterales bacterium]